MPIALHMRRLRAEDLDTVAGFERDIAVLSFPDDPVTDVAFYARKLRQAIDQRDSRPLVAEHEGEIAGWAWIARRENFITHEVYADLRSFYVVEALRGTGAALALMRAVIAHCRAHDLGRIVGRTAATNEAMQAVYELFAFAPKHVVYELALEADAGTDALERESPAPGSRPPVRRFKPGRGRRSGHRTGRNHAP